MKTIRINALLTLAGLSLCAPPAPADSLPTSAPAATVDLMTHEGLAAVGGEWRYRDARIVETDFRAVGPDRKPTGPPNRTYDIEPRAGGLDFDDSSWEVISPTSLQDRRGSGRLCFNWYRLRFTVPALIDGVDPTGCTIVLDTTVDDYAEVWVDGVLSRELGQSGGSMVAGFNVPNRLVVGRGVRPGQTIRLAIFGMNGPISDPPPNYIWMRSATLAFHAEPHAIAPRFVETAIIRNDPALDAIIAPGTQIEKIAEGFIFTEGPVWLPSGELLFSDPNANHIYRWSPTAGVSVFRKSSGYSGADVAEYRQPGSNGLALDAQGRLTICEHGNRRISRLESDGPITVLADRFEGRRLNSPNDLVYRSDGALFFTDPPFGLPRVYDDPRRDQEHFGVYCLRDGRLSLVSTDLKGPNGVALSPDEKFLYVANWDEQRKIVMRYDLDAAGNLSGGRVFFDMTAAPGQEALDGVKVDERGNVFVSGPGGVWVISPDGKHLGTIVGPELPANFAWGDADGRTLYLAARSGVYRIRLAVAGAGR